MKKLLLLFLLPLYMVAQTPTGQETPFNYSIRNNAAPTITQPVYLVTQSVQGIHGKCSPLNLPVPVRVQDSLINVLHKSGSETKTGKLTLNNPSSTGFEIINNIPFIGGYVKNSSFGTGFYVNNESSGTGLLVNKTNASTGDAIYIKNQSGNGLSIKQENDGIGLKINSSNVANGNSISVNFNDSPTFTVNKLGNVIGNSFIKSGGTLDEVLLADGSVINKSLLGSPQNLQQTLDLGSIAYRDGGNSVINLLTGPDDDRQVMFGVGNSTNSSNSLFRLNKNYLQLGFNSAGMSSSMIADYDGFHFTQPNMEYSGSLDPTVHPGTNNFQFPSYSEPIDDQYGGSYFLATNRDLENFVTLNTAQTIGGNKTFSAPAVFDSDVTIGGALLVSSDSHMIGPSLFEQTLNIQTLDNVGLDIGMNDNSAILAANNSANTTVGVINTDAIGGALEVVSYGTDATARIYNTSGGAGLVVHSENNLAARFETNSDNNTKNIIECYGLQVDSLPIFKVTNTGDSHANSFVKNGGTSQQFLKADGTVTTGALPFKGTYSTTATAQTTFTVSIGQTMTNTNYVAAPVARNMLSAVMFSVQNKTTTTFDIVIVGAGLTGAVLYDFVTTP